jgi:glycosyltransferase involved in cell wall biosynthesis
MIDKISLTIPFYNTSKYFLDCIRYSIDDDFVSEIIVNDDQSSEEEWNNLNTIVSELNNPKIKLYRNPINLGGFKNKYKTVKKATTEWVYLLDSDNYPNNDSLNLIKNIQDADNNICYCPETLVMFRNTEDIVRQVDYKYSYDKIGCRESKEAINSRLPEFPMFLNTGNYVVNRDNYLSRMYDAYCNQETSAADCIAFQYNWMVNGGYSKIIPGFKYFHRLRNDSYWMTSGHMAPTKASYYEALFANIQL